MCPFEGGAILLMTYSPVNKMFTKDQTSHAIYNSQKRACCQTRFLQQLTSKSLKDFSNDTGTDSTTTFTDSEAQAFFHRDRVNQGH